MSSSILDLSVSRGGTAADTSSRYSASPCSPAGPVRHDGDSTTEHEATSPDNVDDIHAVDVDSRHVTISSHTPLRSTGDVIDDAGSRDTADYHKLRHRSLEHSHQPYQYLDYQAAAAAAAAARFLVPFPFSSPAAATGSAPMSSSVLPLNFYPLSFPTMAPPPPEAAGFQGAAAAASASSSPVAGGSRSPDVKVKDEGGHVTDPTYAERRRKNNEAARRSRDARRMKERETCLRAALLQQENVRLRAEMAVLKTEITRLHCLLYDKM